jgi:hypothetical protein
MPLEQINYSQVVTLAPQQQRGQVAVLGGGLSMLASSVNQKYSRLPYLVAGSLSSSAPLQPGDEFQLYNGGAQKEPTLFQVQAVLPNAGGVSSTQTVFGTPASPPNNNSGATAQETLGMQFSSSAASPVRAVWYYSNPGLGVPLPTAVALYDTTTGNAVITQGSPVWSGAAGSGWVRCDLTSFAFTLVAGRPYIAAVFGYNGGNVWNWFYSEYFAPGNPGANGVTNGVLTAPAAYQGWVTTGGSITYPNYQWQNSNYWIDIEVGVAGGTVGGNWFLFFEPAPQAVPAAGDAAVAHPEPLSPRWLGSIGHVSGMTRSYTCPGGPDTLQLTLRLPPDLRTDALNPGRVLQVWRGGSCVWEGKLNEPAPAGDGWTVTARGAGHYGDDFAAIWNTWNADDAVNQAIARGMRWSNIYSIGNPAGIYLAQQQDSGSQTVTAHMNLLVTGGGLLWQLLPGIASEVPAGPWLLRVTPWKSDINGNPTAPPDRLLVSSSPVPRTVAADINTLVLRYQATADIAATTTKNAVPATYGTTTTSVPASVAKHGPMEYYLDVSSAGVMTAAAAQAIGQNILTRYVRASWAGPFTVAPGQVRNAAGTPVDLGSDQAGLVYKVIMTDAPFGGEVALGPLVFMSGAYAYDEDTATATITPYQQARTDMASLISALYPNKFALWLFRTLYPNIWWATKLQQVQNSRPRKRRGVRESARQQEETWTETAPAPGRSGWSGPASRSPATSWTAARSSWSGCRGHRSRPRSGRTRQRCQNRTGPCGRGCSASAELR